MDHDDTMEMIGHDGVIIQLNVRVLVRQPSPRFVNDGSCFVKNHPGIYNLAERTRPVVRTNREKITPDP